MKKSYLVVFLLFFQFSVASDLDSDAAITAKLRLSMPVKPFLCTYEECKREFETLRALCGHQRVHGGGCKSEPTKGAEERAAHVLKKIPSDFSAGKLQALCAVSEHDRIQNHNPGEVKSDVCNIFIPQEMNNFDPLAVLLALRTPIEFGKGNILHTSGAIPAALTKENKSTNSPVTSPQPPKRKKFASAISSQGQYDMEIKKKPTWPDCGYSSPKLCYNHSRDLDLCSEYSEPENPDCGEDFSDLCSKYSEQGLGLKLFYEINMTGIPIYRDPTRCDEFELVKKQIEKRIKTELVGKFFSIVRYENVNSNIYIKFLNCKCSVSNKLGHKISFDSKNFKNQVSKLFTRNNPGCTAALGLNSAINFELKSLPNFKTRKSLFWFALADVIKEIGANKSSQ